MAPRGSGLLLGWGIDEDLYLCSLTAGGLMIMMVGCEEVLLGCTLGLVLWTLHAMCLKVI